ncbi:8443_t:CDS:2 [Paraglomus occultum]|uniref:8443_t:CDS:1 n=1 Tax=Paraglomus occultum TaxID=144539 RepID=A0A9N8VXP9_9GLOM|nr:8443_t:CDS:2 [Paraglomus occultum]
MSYPDPDDYLESFLSAQAPANTSQQDTSGYIATGPQINPVGTASYSTIPINFNAPSIFASNTLRTPLQPQTQDPSLFTKPHQIQQQEQQTPSPYDISNVASSMDSFFGLSNVIGGGAGIPNMFNSAGSAVPTESVLPTATPGLTPSLAPPLLGPSLPPGTAGVTPNFPGLYSSTGFDMLGILARVANRPNPQINIGPVDMSCSFLVVDARKYDFPIIYASYTFEKLTGYSNSEIIGRNCRFLQAPDGRVALGSRRRYTDNNAVYHLKSHMVSGKECQASIINYRKGGQAFINLVTVIPITWDGPDIAFFVGFQVDLVEQPNAILEKMKDGTYVVNYQLMNLTAYVPPASFMNPPEGVDDYFRDVTNTSMPFPATAEVYDLIGDNADIEVSRRIWNKTLLEQSDDFIHVLSLKGIFLYCSPSCRQMLEYEPEELVGKSLSTICHPSDIVPVMRELKESSNGVEAVNLVYRVRRKNSGYIWLEALGKLHIEQGKGRKCVILSARERQVYKLQWKDLQAAGGISDHEFWSKLSPEGMYLYASSTCQGILGCSMEELVGTSLYQLVKSDRTTDITRSLSQAKSGSVVSLRHHIQKKNGQFVEIVSTFYPGDLSGNGKASFIICQSKLIATEQRRRSSAGSPPSDSGSSSGGSTPRQSAHLKGISIEHMPEDNIFEELEVARGTSWQYELHQMRLTNKRLREELESIKQARRRRVRICDFCVY